MVTDDERDYMYAEYARDPRMRKNLGIRRRLAPLVDNDRRVAELLHALLLSLPGRPVLYYGDEILMGDNIYLGDRDAVRTPMQWTPDRNGGFSQGRLRAARPAAAHGPRLRLPGGERRGRDCATRRRSCTGCSGMLAVRRQYPVFATGTLEVLPADNPSVLAYVRDRAGGRDGRATEHSVLCVNNLSRFAQPAELSLGRWEGATPVELLGRAPFPVVDAGAYSVTLGAARLLLARAGER